MRVFDLHCDTIGECYKNNVDLYDNDMHLSLKRASIYDEYRQIFAVWIPDELRGNCAVEYFDNVADLFEKSIDLNCDLISRYRDIKSTKIKAILSVEGASACGGTIDGLRHLYERGVRVVTLTWNGENEIGSGAFSHGGLTPFAKDFLKVSEELGMVIDVSHLNEQGFRELAEIYSGPFIASHSNADIVENYYGHKRNLRDWQIDVIRDRGGLIGLNFCGDFIDSAGCEGLGSLARQIEYFSAKGCEDIIALGSDFDGCDMHSDFAGVEKFESLYNGLIKYGISRDVLDKLFYDNAERFFRFI